jgi:RNA polymerase sigma factor (sigma-70 family)
MWSRSRASRADDGDDGGLAGAVAAGETQRAMTLLVAQHGDHIYGYCRRMLGNAADGDDVSQTVFVQAFQRLHGVAQATSPRAWLLAIARHRCLDRLKAARRAPPTVEHDELCADPALPRARDDDPRVREALDDCLDRLDARTRAVVVLRFHDELSYDEISALTADTAGALRVRIARALPAIRRCLETKGVQP